MSVLASAILLGIIFLIFCVVSRAYKDEGTALTKPLVFPLDDYTEERRRMWIAENEACVEDRKRNRRALAQEWSIKSVYVWQLYYQRKWNEAWNGCVHAKGD
jgi:hypothetical protein